MFLEHEEDEPDPSKAAKRPRDDDEAPQSKRRKVDPDQDDEDDSDNEDEPKGVAKSADQIPGFANQVLKDPALLALDQEQEAKVLCLISPSFVCFVLVVISSSC